MAGGEWFIVLVVVGVVLFTAMTDRLCPGERLCERCRCRNEPWMGAIHPRWCPDCARLISTGLETAEGERDGE